MGLLALGHDQAGGTRRAPVDPEGRTALVERAGEDQVELATRPRR